MTVFTHYRPDFDDSDDGSKVFRYLYFVFRSAAGKVLFAVITSLFNLLSIRCDDETGGSNNDKERFAR